MIDTSLVREFTYSLGDFAYGLGKNPFTASIQLKETIKTSVCDYSKLNAGVVFKGNVEMTCLNLQQTKKGSKIAALFVPLRTHTWKEVALDMLIPLTRRVFADCEKVTFKQVCLLVFSAVADLFTLVFRFFTVVPAYFYHQSHPHPLESNVETKAESLYVSYEKTWVISATDNLRTEEEQSIEVHLSTTFFWRVDLVSPLVTHSLYEGEKKSMDSHKGLPFCYEKIADYTKRTKFSETEQLWNVTVNQFTHSLTQNNLGNLLSEKFREPSLFYA